MSAAEFRGQVLSLLLGGMIPFWVLYLMIAPGPGRP
jgi:hypothetical protein